MVAHLAVILAEGDTGIDGGLAGSHRHGGGIADDDSAIHQRAAGTRIRKLRKLGNGLHHLTGALATGDHDYDIHRGVLGEQLLQHGFAGAEWPGNAAGAATRHGKKGIDQPDGRNHRFLRVEPFGGARTQQVLGERSAHRPTLRQVQRTLAPLRIADAGHRGIHCDAALLDPGDLHLALLVEGHHDLVDEGAFLDGAEQATGPQSRPGLNLRDERPLLAGIQRLQRHAARQEGAILNGDVLERVLQAVVDLAKQPRSERHREHLAALHHGVPHGHSTGVLEHLHVGEFAAHPQHLGFEPLLVTRGRTAARLDVDDFVLSERQAPAVPPARADRHQTLLHGHHP